MKVENFPQLVKAVKYLLTGGGSSKYKVYTVQLSQVGPSAPIVTIGDNTIGSIIATRVQTGVYIFTLAGAFKTGKTFLFINGHNDVSGTISTNLYDEDRVVVATYNLSNAPSDGILYETTFEIRVYN